MPDPKPVVSEKGKDVFFSGNKAYAFDGTAYTYLDPKQDSARTASAPLVVKADGKGNSPAVSFSMLEAGTSASGKKITKMPVVNNFKTVTLEATNDAKPTIISLPAGLQSLTIAGDGKGEGRVAVGPARQTISGLTIGVPGRNGKAQAPAVLQLSGLENAMGVTTQYDGVDTIKVRAESRLVAGKNEGDITLEMVGPNGKMRPVLTVQKGAKAAVVYTNDGSMTDPAKMETAYMIDASKSLEDNQKVFAKAQQKALDATEANIKKLQQLHSQLKAKAPKIEKVAPREVGMMDALGQTRDGLAQVTGLTLDESSPVGKALERIETPATPFAPGSTRYLS